MSIPYNFVRFVSDEEILINCVEEKKKKTLKELNARSKLFDTTQWKIKYKKNDEQELAFLMEKLRDCGFYFFGSSAGWPPAAIFEYLREKNLVRGKIIEILWGRDGNIITRDR